MEPVSSYWNGTAVVLSQMDMEDDACTMATNKIVVCSLSQIIGYHVHDEAPEFSFKYSVPMLVLEYVYMRM